MKEIVVYKFNQKRILFVEKLNDAHVSKREYCHLTIKKGSDFIQELKDRIIVI